MSRYRGWIAIALMLGISVVALAAYGTASGTPSLRDRAQSIASQVRCPACQGETVAESQTQIAQAIRALIVQRLKAGQSADQIKAYLASRFGDRILMAPPQSGVDWLAWLAPPLLILGGLGLIVTLVLDWRRRSKEVRLRANRAYVERVREEVGGTAT